MKTNKKLEIEGLTLLSDNELMLMNGGGDNLFYDAGVAFGKFLVKLFRTAPGDGCTECIPMMI